jgi:hypothetical protein
MVVDDVIVPDMPLVASHRSLEPDPLNGLFVYVYVEPESTQTVAVELAVTEYCDPSEI